MTESLTISKRLLMKHPNRILKEFKNLHRLYNEGAIFTSIDTETTTSSSKTGRIIEIGAVQFSKDGVISKWHHLFNPHCEIPDFITELTHITNEMVYSCPYVEDYIADFKEYIGKTILIAHNAQFDLNFLNMECEKASITPTTNNTIDTLQFSRWAFPDFESHKLAFLANQLQIDKGNSHRALDDAITCMELFKKCVEIKVKPNYVVPLQDQ